MQSKVRLYGIAREVVGFAKSADAAALNKNHRNYIQWPCPMSHKSLLPAGLSTVLMDSSRLQ